MTFFYIHEMILLDQNKKQYTVHLQACDWSSLDILKRPISSSVITVYRVTAKKVNIFKWTQLSRRYTRIVIRAKARKTSFLISAYIFLSCIFRLGLAYLVKMDVVDCVYVFPNCAV